MSNNSEYLTFGGQAVVEGVMMRSPKHFAVACLAPNGEIVVQQEALEKTWVAKQKWLKLAFIRGGFALFDSMALGIKAMRFASQVQLDETKQAPTADGKPAPTSNVPNQKIQDQLVAGTMIFSLFFAILLFVFVPNLIGEKLAAAGNDTQKNMVSGLIKFVMFFGYILLISRMEGIKRVFQFHGAEHKAINCMEAGKELTVENCRPITRLHPRCGTSFAVVVLIVGFVVFTFLPRRPLEGLGVTGLIPSMLVRVALEIPVLFFVAGISYELIRLAGKFKNATLVNILFWPGLMTQYITTNEPDDKQLEVAIASLNAVIDAERESAAAVA